MTNKELDSFKKAVETKEYRKPTDLMDLSEAYWNEIAKRHYNFNRSETELRLLHALSIKDMKDFFQVLSTKYATNIPLYIFIVSNFF